MQTRFDKHVDFLLEYAGASIRYLVRRDILHTPVNDPDMVSLREEIKNQPNVRKILSAQNEDGWLGHELHGSDGMDGLLGGLLNAGVERDDPAVKRAIDALVTPEIASRHKNWYRGGEALDLDGRGGNRAVTAQILSWVNYPEDCPIMSEQIALAFEHLSAVTGYSSIDDFSIRGKNERYYKPHARFPGANHISLLAATESWRTDESVDTARRAVRHGYELMKDVDEYITFKKPAELGGGFVGPFNYNWQALKPVTLSEIYGFMQNPYPFGFAFWLGSVSGVPDFALQSTETYEALAELLEVDDIVSLLPEKSFRAFRQVMGKEPNMRRKYAAKCELTYAILRACCGVL